MGSDGTLVLMGMGANLSFPDSQLVSTQSSFRAGLTLQGELCVLTASTPHAGGRQDTENTPQAETGEFPEAHGLARLAYTVVSKTRDHLQHSGR